MLYLLMVHAMAFGLVFGAGWLINVFRGDWQTADALRCGRRTNASSRGGGWLTFPAVGKQLATMKRRVPSRVLQPIQGATSMQGGRR